MKGANIMHCEISLGSATSNRIAGHTMPADAIADIQSGKWAKQIAALRNSSGDEADKLKVYEDVYRDIHRKSTLASTSWLEDKQRAIERNFNVSLVAMMNRNRR